MSLVNVRTALGTAQIAGNRFECAGEILYRHKKRLFIYKRQQFL